MNLLASILLVSTALTACGLPFAEPGDEDAFEGWDGSHIQEQAQPADPKEPWVQIVSWHPRAFVYHNFMTDEECEHIKRLAAPTMKRSTVVGADGSSVHDEYRTSSGTFVKRRHDEVVSGVEARVARWSHLPEEHAEDLQVLRYGYHQSYRPHMDTLDGDEAGPRVATVLLYLSDVEEGGETAFPGSKEWASESLPEALGPFSECTQGGVAFKPKKGDALLFWSMLPDAKREDPSSMHTGCPVLKGVKWTATKWIHARPFRPTTFGVVGEEDPDPGLCEDRSRECAAWARMGQCDENRAFMAGEGDLLGHCRKSCGACSACPDPEALPRCYNENRRALGYLEAEPAEYHLYPALDGVPPPEPS